MADQHQRRTIYYAGHVQGVGFRYMARTIAQTCRVTGIVQNLDDGRVLLVVEGPQPEIEGFLTRVDDEMGRYIRDRKVTTGPATGEFHDFHIRAN